MLAEQGEDPGIAEKGDSFIWNASVPHFVKNIGEEPAKVLILIYTDTELDDIL
ncbi:hypothetical protein B481_2728 [Planococcus halocryophilus Or1]|nr:hypothetical protein B481_2728 [Planococcus halocryophilus Or1]